MSVENESTDHIQDSNFNVFYTRHLRSYFESNAPLETVRPLIQFVKNLPLILEELVPKLTLQELKDEIALAQIRYEATAKVYREIQKESEITVNLLKSGACLADNFAILKSFASDRPRYHVSKHLMIDKLPEIVKDESPFY
jgi:hypothetical protein